MNESLVRAFDGSPLAGRRLVPIVYLDESGTSRREPLALVAGVVVHGDLQMVAVEEHLQRLVRKHIPETDWENFSFHATNIWSGTKYYKDDDAWPLKRRLAILHDLVEIPQKFDLPIVFRDCPRDVPVTVPPDVVLDERGRDAIVHTVAFFQCVCLVEKNMRNIWPDEVALLIAEDRPAVKKTVREVQLWAQNKTLPRRLDQREYLPLTHIRDTVHWAGKKESPLLQLADTCAFVIRGHLNDRRYNQPLYSKLHPVMVTHPKSDAERKSSLPSLLCRRLASETAPWQSFRALSPIPRDRRPLRLLSQSRRTVCIALDLRAWVRASCSWANRISHPARPQGGRRRPVASRAMATASKPASIGFSRSGIAYE